MGMIDYWMKQDKSVLVEQIQNLRKGKGVLQRYSIYCGVCISLNKMPEAFDEFSKHTVLHQAKMCSK